MSEYKLKTPKKLEDAVVGTYKKIEDTVVGTYQKVENTVVGAYQKVEDSTVGGYKKIEKAFVDAFLEKKDGSEQTGDDNPQPGSPDAGQPAETASGRL